jgi:hypothetical protein
MRKPILVALGLLLASLAALAQPSNDDCTNPIPITDVTNYCSAANAFTSAGATVSGYGAANCFGTAGNDVWFSFVPQFTDVTVIIRGATTQGPGGTLQDPLVALYYGSCGGVLNEVQCQSAVGNSNIVEASESGLLVGSTYLIRVQGAANGTGSFQLCLNNYNPPVEPTSDCPTASVLCDKSPFVVQSVTGAGSNISELNDATCFSNGAPGNFESNSTWFTWICAQSGTLEFTLTPLNIADDLDFVLYRLPNGPGNCQGKQVVRCMASGEFNYLSPCMGPTGLRPGDSDTSEDAGCTDATATTPGFRPSTWWPAKRTPSASITSLPAATDSPIQFGGSRYFPRPRSRRFTTVPARRLPGHTSCRCRMPPRFALGNVISRAKLELRRRLRTLAPPPASWPAHRHLQHAPAYIR